MLTITQGDATNITFTFTDSSDAAYDLTGLTATVTVKRTFDDLDAATVFSDTLTIATPTSGIGVWAISAAESRYLLGYYVVDIRLSNATTPYIDVLYIKSRVLRAI